MENTGDYSMILKWGMDVLCRNGVEKQKDANTISHKMLGNVIKAKSPLRKLLCTSNSSLPFPSNIGLL